MDLKLTNGFTHGTTPAISAIRSIVFADSPKAPRQRQSTSATAGQPLGNRWATAGQPLGNRWAAGAIAVSRTFALRPEARTSRAVTARPRIEIQRAFQPSGRHDCPAKKPLSPTWLGSGGHRSGTHSLA